jgi:hypothetical protein
MSVVLTERATKLLKLLQSEGFCSYDDYLEAHGFQGTVPGICRSKECDFVITVEGDQRAGWCDECQTESVVSLHILAGAV